MLRVSRSTSGAARARRLCFCLIGIVALLGLNGLAPVPARAEPGVLTVSGGTDLGPVTNRASGFLNTDAPDGTRAQALRPQAWRMGGVQPQYSDLYNRAKRHGAKVIWVIGDDWINQTGNLQPWRDWPAYEAFIRHNVRRHLAEFPVDTWDLHNEPESFGPYGGSRQDYLDLYLHAYKAIKEVDPSARVQGPSIVRFQTKPYVACDPNAIVATYECDARYAPLAGTPIGPPRSAAWVDLTSFLDFAAKPHPELGGKSMVLDQVTWHELCIGDPDCNPHIIEDHARQMREMIAARPSLGSPGITINEYTGPQVMDVPGWVAGYIAAIDNVEVAQSARACWTEPSGLEQCFSDTLDGLIGPDGTTPRSAYWVYKAYADMVGTRVASAVPSRAFSSYATRDDANQELRLLLGRHEKPCSAAPSVRCTALTPLTQLPTTPLTVKVDVPWAITSAAVTVQRLARPAVNLSYNRAGFQTTSLLTLPVVNGSVTVPLDAIADGDAWHIVVGAGGGPADHTVSPMAPTHCPIGDCLGGGHQGTWSPTSSMYYGRTRAQTVSLDDGRVLLTGGTYNFGSRPFTKLYDPATGTWTTAANQSGASGSPRQQHTLTVLADGTVLSAGGTNNDNGSVVNPADRFDPTTGRWRKTAALITPRYDHAATRLRDGRVLVVGGYQLVVGGAVTTASAEIYDPAGGGGAGTWVPTGSMLAPRSGATATMLDDGRVLVTGGSSAPGTALPSAEIFDPASGTWSSTGSMAGARAFHTATLLPTGKVLAAGGGAPFGNGRVGLQGGGQIVQPDVLVTGTSEVFDPATGVWSAAGAVPARSRHTATALADGRVLLTGGTGQDGKYLASSYLFDPIAGRWDPSGSMATSRAFHTANLLPSGRVLVTGGDDAFADSTDRYAFLHTLSSAELWKPSRVRR